MKLPRLSVSPETARMLELGHPWVLADAHTRRWPAGPAGEAVLLTDGRQVLATALRDDDSRIVARVLAPGAVTLTPDWLNGRLRAAQALRRNHGLLGETDAYRLINAEGDGLPGLVVDRYGHYLLVQCYSGCWEPHLDMLVQGLQQLATAAGIWLKERPRDTRGTAARRGGATDYGRLLAGSRPPERLLVEENGLRYLVNLTEGLHTGLFPDQRVNRRDLMARAAGRRVLNLFSYTGAFSVAAAAGGAKQVTSVDASAGYMHWAQDNFGVNRLNPRQHEFLVGDVFQVLGDLARDGRRFDLVLMDPPAFSTTRKSRFATRGGTSRAVAAALPLLEPGGLLLASCNHQKMSEAEYFKELRRGALEAGTGLRVLRNGGQPEDFPYAVGFPEGRYLKFAVCVRD